MVEGPTRADREDMRQHAFQIIEHIPGGNPQRVETSLGQHGIALQVALWTVTHRVRLTVDLDRQPTLEAGAIPDIAPARKLAAKPKPLGTFPQLLPQDDLGQGQLSAKLARDA